MKASRQHWLSLPLSLLFLSSSFAQVPLPNPAWLPPPATSGAVASPNSARPNHQWGTLLGDLLYFYDAQRSGKLSNNRVEWRNDSLVEDGKDQGVDLGGGFYDAGDYIKATFPLSWTLNSLCWSALSFPSGFSSSNQTAYLDSTLRWGLDWLIKAHPSNNTLFVLVGDGARDNAYWGGDQSIPTPRPAYQINDTHPGTDAAAAASAAFSSCSLLYSNHTLSTNSSIPTSFINNTYSTRLLNHARGLYSFAVNATGGMKKYQESVPAVEEIYSSSGYYDDLSLAATFLGFAANDGQILKQAKSYWDQGHLTNADPSLNWDQKASAIPVLMTQILSLPSAASLASSSGQDVNSWKSTAQGVLDKLAGANSDGLSLTSGGLLWFDKTSDLASLNPALNAAWLLALYSPYATSQDKTNGYLSFARLQLDYVLGDNPMSMPYVVGVNPNSPQNPHSALASGVQGNAFNNNDSDINTNPPTEAHVLYGAVLGGPDQQDQFWDQRSDWVQTEPALDYTAPLVGLAAWSVAVNGNDPFYVRLQEGAYTSHRPPGEGRPCQEGETCESDGVYTFSQGERIATGVVLGLGAVLVLVGYCWFAVEWWRFRRGNREPPPPYHLRDRSGASSEGKPVHGRAGTAVSNGGHSRSVSRGVPPPLPPRRG